MGEGHTPTLDLMIEAALEHFGDQISKSPVPEIAPNSHLGPSSGLLFPGRVAVLSGKLLVADSGHHRVLLVDSDSGQVEAKIGSGDSGLVDGSFEEARFHFPQGIIFLDENTAFVADTENNAIRMVRENMNLN
jgi:NHL repeat